MVPFADRGLRTGIVRCDYQRGHQHKEGHNAGAEGRASSGGDAIEAAGRHAVRKQLIQVY